MSGLEVRAQGDRVTLRKRAKKGVGVQHVLRSRSTGGSARTLSYRRPMYWPAMTHPTTGLVPALSASRLTGFSFRDEWNNDHKKQPCAGRGGRGCGHAEAKFRSQRASSQLRRTKRQNEAGPFLTLSRATDRRGLSGGIE